MYLYTKRCLDPSEFRQTFNIFLWTEVVLYMVPMPIDVSAILLSWFRTLASIQTKRANETVHFCPKGHFLHLRISWWAKKYSGLVTSDSCYIPFSRIKLSHLYQYPNYLELWLSMIQFVQVRKKQDQEYHFLDRNSDLKSFCSRSFDSILADTITSLIKLLSGN
jgi:hypothetical protein